jgi:hypothetical protein
VNEEQSANEPETSGATEEIYDEAEKDDVTAPVRFDVTSYGADPDVEGLVRRLRRQEILIPPFQRDYIWNISEASQFIESLLMGLPVPGVFFANDHKTNKLLVIDGQQRLKSLLFFYDGYFNPKPGEKKQRVFALAKVQKQFDGRTYQKLEERDRIRLDNSVIHATIVKQNSPPSEDTSTYHIFARLNSGGRLLAPQQIRVALYHGGLMNRLKDLNDHKIWRRIFGKPSARLKDQELILRFLALYYEAERYARPMEEFLSLFSGRWTNPDEKMLQEAESRFSDCVDLFWKGLEHTVFRPTRALNAAVFDSCMVGLARRLERKPYPDPHRIKEAYNNLVQDKDYSEATSRSTADEKFVKRRLEMATEAFSKL